MSGTTDDRWDTDLSSGEVKRLDPAGKHSRTATSFRRKVELLEQYGRFGVALEHIDAIPTDRAKLRRWHDPGSKLWQWSDPVIDLPGGRNGNLVTRFYEALKTIRKRRGDTRVEIAVELEAQKQIIANLERQNFSLLDRIAQLELRVGTQPIVTR